MPAISRAQLMKELLPGLNEIFGMEYKRYEQQHKMLYDISTSTRSFEEDLKVGGFDAAPVKNEGAAIAFDSAQEAWAQRYTHQTIALGFAITEEAVEDNLYDSLSQRYTKALARAMAHTKEVKAAIPYNTGFTSYNSGDGTTLFSTSHTNIDGSSNSNRPSTATDLNETSLEAHCIQISKWTDERGLLIQAMPRKLLIPTDLKFVAKRVLDSDLRVGTADNDTNALKDMSAIPEGFAVNNYFTDTDAYFIKTDIPNGPRMFMRAALKTGMDTDFYTGNSLYKARERYSFGVSDPLGLFGSPGA